MSELRRGQLGLQPDLGSSLFPLYLSPDWELRGEEVLSSWPHLPRASIKVGWGGEGGRCGCREGAAGCGANAVDPRCSY